MLLISLYQRCATSFFRKQSSVGGTRPQGRQRRGSTLVARRNQTNCEGARQKTTEEEWQGEDGDAKEIVIFSKSRSRRAGAAQKSADCRLSVCPASEGPPAVGGRSARIHTRGNRMRKYFRFGFRYLGWSDDYARVPAEGPTRIFTPRWGVREVSSFFVRLIWLPAHRGW